MVPNISIAAARDSKPAPVQIGPQLRAELERRVRELEAHFRPTPRDMRELAQLKDFLRATPLEAQ